MIQLEKRTDHLQQLCGMYVSGWFDEERKKSYFEFREDPTGPVLASTYTYKKAKVLAKGVQIGRKL